MVRREKFERVKCPVGNEEKPCREHCYAGHVTILYTVENVEVRERVVN